MRRFIPAWAGNTKRSHESRPGASVHPRVGGEHAHMRFPAKPLRGSSPRGRGTRVQEPERILIHRFIPAWAGNTPTRGDRLNRKAVHPRVGGEHLPIYSNVSLRYGSSPRGRGTRNPPVSRTARAAITVHPRVGGEHRDLLASTQDECGSSPRGRGTRREDCEPSTSHRFIPAWAGNTAEHRGTAPCSTVHPRVGGEHPRAP